MSPMKWTLLNFIAQSSIIQIISFISMKKFYSVNKNKTYMLNNKMTWKW